MIAFGTRESGERRRRQLRLERDPYYKAEWMETDEDPILSPTIFLIEQAPNSILPVHFHRQNQFQLFIDGTGRIGGHVVEPVMVHYAGAYTAYGPLTAGPEGLKYFTIRPVYDNGALLIRTHHDQMVKGPKRFDQSETITPSPVHHLASLTGREGENVFQDSTDGLGARVFRLPAAEGFDIPNDDGAASHFVVVLAGEAIVEDRSLSTWESVFVTSDEPSRRITAGPGGVEFVVMAVPAKDPAYQNQPDSRTS
jgi:hypothetical protein